MTSEITLRPYQQQALDAIIKGFEEHRRQIIVLPTGGGKTIIFAKLAEFFATRGARVLILAHRDELLQQAQDKLRSATGITAQIEAAQQRASLDAPVVIGSVQTLSREARLTRWPNEHFGLLVCDECHHLLSESYQRIIEHFRAARLLGVTATPDRGDKRDVAKWFDHEAYSVSLQDLIRDGYLAPIKVHAEKVEIDMRNVHSRAGDFAADETGHAIEPALAEIAQLIADKYPERRTLAFLPLCATSEKFSALCRDAGIRAEHVDGNSPDRDAIRERFESGETQLVSNAMLWTEGFDAPACDMIVPLRPTRVRSLLAQQIGRGTRLAYPGKELIVLDFLWLTERHEVVNPFALAAETEEDTKAAMRKARQANGSGVDLLETTARVRAEREESLREQLDRAAKGHKDGKSARQYQLYDICRALGAPHIAEYSPVFGHDAQPPSAKQAALLAKWRIQGVMSMGQASQIIGVAMRRISAGLATPAQLYWLRKNHVPDAEKLSKITASKILDKLFSR